MKMKTPLIRYYLEKPKDNSERRKLLVMAEVSYGYSELNLKGKRRNKPFRITTKARIKPENFGTTDKPYKLDSKTFTKFSRNNAFVKNAMNQIELAVNRVANDFAVQNIFPKPQQFKTAVQKELGYVPLENNESTILQYLKQSIERERAKSGGTRKDALKIGTINVYVGLSHHVENYQIATGEILTFNNFTENKYWNFWTVIDKIFRDEVKVNNPNQPKKQRKDKNGYSSSTIQKLQKKLLKILREAKTDGFSVAMNLEKKELSLKDVEAMKNTYVTEDEIKLVLETDVSSEENLQLAKDYVIVGALTGLRLGNMSQIHSLAVEEYQDEKYNFKYLHTSIEKGGGSEVSIPLMKPVVDIAARHGGKLPNFSSPHLNEHIRELYKVLGIDDEIIVIKKTMDGEAIVTKEKKHDVISSHDTRKGFYTNLVLHKVMPTAIDYITHPKKTPINPMDKFYNKTTTIDKAKIFVDEIFKIKSDIYTF